MTARVITIDGPAGCGKSTVARALAEALGGLAFNTGHIYRALTWLALEVGVALDDPEAILALLDRHRIGVTEHGCELRVTVDGNEPGDALRTPRVTSEIHWVADDVAIRARLLPVQRDLPEGRIVVAEGRDLGTVVYPDAALKIFLTASAEERARRRHRELEEGGTAVELTAVLADVERRDRFDRERVVAPLRPAADARHLDTTLLGPEEAVAAIRREVPPAWFPAGQD